MNINDIARLAGVSTATVSRVLNKQGNVKEETAEKILDVVKKYNYVPNAVARSLCTNNRKSIGVIVPDVTNEFFAESIRGITDVAEENGYSMLFYNTDEKKEREHAYLKAVESEKLAGLIIAPVDSEDEFTKLELSFMEKKNIPVVLLDRDLKNINMDGVFVDNYLGAYEGVTNLIMAGHKKIAMIKGLDSSLPGRERYKGYLDALKDADIEINKEYICNGNFKFECAYKKMSILMERDNPPTALFAVNNLTSLGGLKYLTEKGIKVGEEFSLLGFDQINTLEMVDYPFSHVRRDATRQGKEAMRMLHEKIIANREGKKREIKKIILKPEVVLRGSEKYRF